MESHEDVEELKLQRERHVARLKECAGSKQHKQLRRRLLQKIGKLNSRIEQVEKAQPEGGKATKKSKRAPEATAAGEKVAVDTSGASEDQAPSTKKTRADIVEGRERAQPRTAAPASKKKTKKPNKRTRYLNQQIAAYAQRKELKKALDLYEGAKAKGIADVHTYTNIINAQIRCGQLASAEQVFEELMRTRGMPPNVVSFTVMLKGYSNQGLMEDAKKLLKRMTTDCHPPIVPNLRTANTFIRGCLRVGAIADAEWALHRMLDSELWGVDPDRSTYTAVVSLMCQALRLRDAERLLALVASLPEPSYTGGQGGGDNGAGGGSSSHLSVERLYIQVARAAILCGNAESTEAALRAASKALENSSHLKEKMEARRNRSVMSKKADGGRDSKKRQSKRRQQSADLFRRHQLREEGQTFQRVCGFAIECGVPVSIDLINDAIGGDDVVVKPTSALAQKAAAVATAVKAGQRPVVEGPDLVPFFGRVFCWPPEASNSRLLEGQARPRFADPAVYARRLVKHLSESFGLGAWAKTRASSSDVENGEKSVAIVNSVRRQLFRSFDKGQQPDDPFIFNFDRLFTMRSTGLGGNKKSNASGEEGLVDMSRTPVKLEIGAGTGEWAIAQAQADHDSNTGDPLARWLTLELRHDRVYETFANSVFESLDNLCLLRGNALEVVQDHFPTGRVERVFVNHPEPPERTMALVVNNKLLREQQQRERDGLPPTQLEEVDALVTENHMLNEDMFLELRRILEPEGTICIVTDNSRYAHFLAEQLSRMRMPIDETDDEVNQDAWAFHSLPAADSRFMQKHGVVNGRIEICKGVPSHEAGLAVQSSSYFDRLWTQGGTSARYVIILTRLPYKQFVAARRKKNAARGLADAQYGTNAQDIQNAASSTDAAGGSGITPSVKGRKRRLATTTTPGSAADMLERGVMADHLPGNLSSLGSLDGDADVEDAWSAFLNGTAGAAATIAAKNAIAAEAASKSKSKGKAGIGRYGREELDDDEGDDGEAMADLLDAEPRTAAQLDPHFSDSDGASDYEAGAPNGKGGDDWAVLKAKKNHKQKKEARRKPRGPQRNNIREFHRQNKLRREEQEYNRQSGKRGSW